MKDMESYNLKHHIVEHDARFELARKISAKAKNIKSGKEPRWSALIENELFGKLIKLARHAEGNLAFDPKLVMERIRVYVFPDFAFYSSLWTLLLVMSYPKRFP